MASEGASRRRVDAELVRRGLVRSREEAKVAVESNRVQVDGAPVRKVSSLVLPSQRLIVGGPPPRFVSRGGEKLQHALERFAVTVEGRRALDAGISTGGFADCLLQAGALVVVGVDVGYGQLAERLRRDPRVVLHERTHVRDLVAADIGAPFDLLVADLSFISLSTVLPVLLPLVAGDGEAVVLVKPQFEVGREGVGRGGVVRDPAMWRRALGRTMVATASCGWRMRDVTVSPLRGAAGNVEFLAHLTRDQGDQAGEAEDAATARDREMIDAALAELDSVTVASDGAAVLSEDVEGSA
jgi:23S rRNA (cytidine1920-2'-O)/16S rRNA (cytidine1409-2'-O)-methyltransferase